MGLWGEGSSLNIGGVFDGEMSSHGTGARIRLGIDLPGPLPDIQLVNVTVPGFAKGCQIPDDRAARSQASQARLHRQHGTSGERATEANMTRRRQGGASAPTRRSSSGSSSPVHRHRNGGGGGGIAPASASLRPAIGVGLGGHRQKHEIAPGIPCSTCALGITKPVR